jgi:hypothetical protein
MSSEENVSDIMGKKIFFLFPTVVVQNRIISELVQQEYEVYVAKDKDTLRLVLRKYPDSIVFVDINEKMPEREWEPWITAVMNAPDTKKVSIGIVTANDDELIKRKYILSLKITGGYTVLRFDLDKAVKRITDILQSAEAKGRRKFIRATTGTDSNTTINIPLYGAFVNGEIKDISVVGLSCTLEGSPDVSKNALFKDIQVKLQSTLLKIEGIIFGTRTDSNNEKIYVILFTQRTDPDVRAKIRKYIQQNLQTKMEAELK